MKGSILTVIGIIFSMTLWSQQLVYRPVNPAFGGETFNYNWLLSSAQAQNDIERPQSSTLNNLNAGTNLDDFKETLNRQILSELSRQLVSNQFGENGLENGTYSIGDFKIDVNSSIEGIVVTIFDTNLGEQTQLIVPFY